MLVVANEVVVVAAVLVVAGGAVVVSTVSDNIFIAGSESITGSGNITGAAVRGGHLASLSTHKNLLSPPPSSNLQHFSSFPSSHSKFGTLSWQVLNEANPILQSSSVAVQRLSLELSRTQQYGNSVGHPLVPSTLILHFSPAPDFVVVVAVLLLVLVVSRRQNVS